MYIKHPDRELIHVSVSASDHDSFDEFAGVSVAEVLDADEPQHVAAVSVDHEDGAGHMRITVDQAVALRDALSEIIWQRTRKTNN